MRRILFGSCALLAAGCATPDMNASNADHQQLIRASGSDREPPPQLRQPERRGWGGNIYRGRYAN
jgi:hypothetical protein